MRPTEAVYRNFTPLLHETVGQITSDEVGGWNVKAQRFATIQSYTKLKRELKKFSREGRRFLGPRGIQAYRVVFEAIIAGLECGQLRRSNCYRTVFKDRRDWARFAKDFEHKLHSHYWVNERYRYALNHLQVTFIPTQYNEIATALLEELRAKPIPDESLATA